MTLLTLLAGRAACARADAALGRRALASAASSRVTSVAQLASEQAVGVTFADGATARFHALWLRDHCRCARCVHPETRQRQLDTASIPLDAPLRSLQVAKGGQGLTVVWDAPVCGSSCITSAFDGQWLREHAYALDGDVPDATAKRAYPPSYRQARTPSKTLWCGSEFTLPAHSFLSCMTDIAPLMRDLYAYGLVRVTAAPKTMADTEAFANRIGFPLRTIYGTMWTTNPAEDDQGYNDTASSNAELLHHTDGTYMRDPPGLQIFNCVAQAGAGGESRYLDGFRVAETLRLEAPDAFRVLSETPLPYFTVDRDAHLATMEPLIRLDVQGNVTQFRHNDYDRAPLTHLSFEAVGAFYAAHRQLLRVMRRPEMEVCVRLQQGDLVVVDNQRVLHGRHAFQGGERALIGCYIGRTEYESRLRVLDII